MKQLLFVTAILCTGLAKAQSEKPLPPPPPERAPDVVIKYVDEPAQFPGGMAAMKKFIAENLVYPEEAKAAGIQGKCYLNFVVGADGKISNIGVKRGVPDCPACDAEAIRVVKLMPDWIPGAQNGKPVKMAFNLPITFTPN